MCLHASSFEAKLSAFGRISWIVSLNTVMSNPLYTCRCTLKRDDCLICNGSVHELYGRPFFSSELFLVNPLSRNLDLVSYLCRE